VNLRNRLEVFQRTKFMKLSRRSFWKFHWNIEVDLFVKNKLWKIDRNSWNNIFLLIKLVGLYLLERQTDKVVNATWNKFPLYIQLNYLMHGCLKKQLCGWPTVAFVS